MPGWVHLAVVVCGGWLLALTFVLSWLKCAARADEAIEPLPPAPPNARPRFGDRHGGRLREIAAPCSTVERLIRVPGQDPSSIQVEVTMPSDFMRQKLAEIEERMRALTERIDELEALRQERDELARARAALVEALAAERAATARARHEHEPSSRSVAAKPARARRAPSSSALAPEAERVADDVLALLADAPGLTVDELAARTGNTPTAIHRLLVVLVAGGRVVRDDGHFSPA